MQWSRFDKFLCSIYSVIYWAHEIPGAIWSIHIDTNSSLGHYHALRLLDSWHSIVQYRDSVKSVPTRCTFSHVVSFCQCNLNSVAPKNGGWISNSVLVLNIFQMPQVPLLLFRSDEGGRQYLPFRSEFFRAVLHCTKFYHILHRNKCKKRTWFDADFY